MLGCLAYSSRLGVLDEIDAGATLAIQKPALVAPETDTGSAAFARRSSRAAPATLPASAFFLTFAGDSETKRKK
ncbi:hypothetical protein V6N12_072869 [Hibiscus sabdariffa]|uniref:Uncharacterized protein n=1 Tax=Hibiscus sabdariffa TaxID=183260 RepID=A0ABR2AYF1_9ROSI